MAAYVALRLCDVLPKQKQKRASVADRDVVTSDTFWESFGSTYVYANLLTNTIPAIIGNYHRWLSVHTPISNLANKSHQHDERPQYSTATRQPRLQASRIMQALPPHEPLATHPTHTPITHLRSISASYCIRTMPPRLRAHTSRAQEQRPRPSQQRRHTNRLQCAGRSGRHAAAHHRH